MDYWDAKTDHFTPGESGKRVDCYTSGQMGEDINRRGGRRGEGEGGNSRGMISSRGCFQEVIPYATDGV